MHVLVGVDGCKTKWLAVTQDKNGNISATIHESPKALLESFPRADVIAVDVPLGLAAQGWRKCDENARALLGSPRCNSVFYTPIRELLNAPSWHEANELSKTISGHGVSRQAAGIMPYIRSWDTLMHQSKIAKSKVYEAHPEVSFFGMNNNSPMQYSKKKCAGLEERHELLNRTFGESVIRKALEGLVGERFAQDDLYDAFAALWSARRIATNCANCLPAKPPCDGNGLLMAIRY